MNTTKSIHLSPLVAFFISYLGIAANGLAIPVMWTLIPNQGTSNIQMRIELLERFIQVFGKTRIAFLTTDREFRGGEWFRWLR